jgi:hypothetical protein
MTEDNLLTLPPSIGRRIVEDKSCFLAPLLSRRKFVKLARDCGLEVDDPLLDHGEV